MRITGLQIERFGAWSGLKLEQLPKGLSVFYGRNEAGKTTLLQFLRSMYFGYRNEEIQRYLHPITSSQSLLVAGTRSGGSMSLVSGGVEYHLRRFANLTDKTDTSGELRLTAQNGERVGAHRLLTLLAGVDETIFNNVFAVGLREIQELATLDDTEAAHQLYSLSTGTDRVSLVDIMRQLQSVRDRLVGAGNFDDESYFGQMHQHRQRLQSELRQTAVQRDRWIQLKQQMQSLDAELRQLEEQRREAEQTAKVAEIAVRVATPWQHREQLRAQLEELGAVTEIPATVLDEFEQLEQQVVTCRSSLSSLDAEISHIDQQRQALESQLPAARQRIRVEQMVEQRLTVEQLAEQRSDLQRRWNDLEAEIQLEQEKLGLESDGRSTSSVSQRLIDPRNLFSLLEPARQLERDRELLDQVQQQTARQKDELEKTERELQTAMRREPDLFDEEDASDVVAAVKKTGTMAMSLKQQVRLVKLSRQYHAKLDSLLSQRADAYRNQLLPWDIVIGVGTVFTVGAFMTLMSFFGNWFELARQTRLGLGIAGGIALLLATILKIVLDQATRDQLTDWHAREDQLRRETERVSASVKEIRHDLSRRRRGPVRLEDAESRLKCLESLLPLEAKRRRARQHAQRLEQNTMQIDQRMKLSRQAWDNAVRQAGVSSRITPAQLRDLVDDSARLGRLQQQLKELSGDLESAERQWRSWQQRITTTATGEPQAKGHEPELLSYLNQLAGQVADWEETRRKDHQLRCTQERVRRDHRRNGEELRQLEQQQRDLIASVGAIDISDLQRKRQGFQQSLQWREQLQAVEEQLSAMCPDIDESALDRQFRAHSPEALKAIVQAAQLQSSETEQRSKEISHRQGELTEQIRTLAADRQPARLRLEKSILQQRAADAAEHWRVVGAMGFLLKAVYKKYEKERQPDTLRDASQFLKRMSQERYHRVWSPLAEDILLVDAADGRTIPVQQLSSGTREQVYLSLRLALVSAYARRNIRMPVILDDVLVNFDVDRTRAAAEVLVEFAQQGHQVFIFTCHQHVIDIFRQLRVEVQQLPDREPSTASRSKPRVRKSRGSKKRRHVEADPAHRRFQDFRTRRHESR